MAFNYSPIANEEVNRFNLSHRLQVSDVQILLDHGRFRDAKKVDLNLKINQLEVWSLSHGNVWFAFQVEDNGDIYVQWVSFVSKFRK